MLSAAHFLLGLLLGLFVLRPLVARVEKFRAEQSEQKPLDIAFRPERKGDSRGN